MSWAKSFAWTQIYTQFSRLPKTHSATVVGILKQLFTSFSIAQTTQIKEKLSLKKYFFVEPKWFNCSWKSPFWIDWPKWQRECIYNRINNRICYNHGKVNNTIVMNPFKQITFFLKSLIDSDSPYVIPYVIYIWCLLMPWWTFIIKVTLSVTYFS